MTEAPIGGRTAPREGGAGSAPAHAGWVLLSLILVESVANLNLAVANVALPDIGKAFDSSQSALDLIAVGYSLGLACSVLYLGAVGDRHGRKLMLVLGVALSVPACLLAAYAPTDTVLIAARILGGLSAGMAYPTTLALITALWSGPGRTRSIALWAGLGSAVAALGPLVAGALLLRFWWGSVFLITLPLAAVALVMALIFVPAHVNETTDPVDNLGGVLSALLVAALILSINFAPVPGKGALSLVLGIVAVAAAVAFFIRQRRARKPLYDLQIAGRRVFWVAAVGGIIVFGALMGALFVGQQFMQNVLGYTTLDAGLAILPMAAFMVLVAPGSARLVNGRGSRITLLVGFLFILLGFLTMLLLWGEDVPYWKIGLAYALIGVGVGFAGTPASHSLTASVPVRRVGMASGTADLQRDLGGAIMQSVFGALLAAGYAAALAATIASSPNADQISASMQNELTKSFSSAADAAQQFPQYADQITAAAKTSFLAGDQWAYTAGIVAILAGAALVYFLFPHHQPEQDLLARYHAQDTGAPEA
jgi:MFS family permease